MGHALQSQNRIVEATGVPADPHDAGRQAGIHLAIEGFFASAAANQDVQAEIMAAIRLPVRRQKRRGDRQMLVKWWKASIRWRLFNNSSIS
ncbi:hypothetical protein [Sphingobium aquiterrae]|uniref:hypothetical protein n=1 Tax=Sphingobium aquiterrae TaxID=2038656 RepID=UPI00301752E5